MVTQFSGTLAVNNFH